MQHHPNSQLRHDSALGNVISLDLTLSGNTAHQIAVRVAGVSVMHSHTYTTMIFTHLHSVVLIKIRQWTIIAHVCKCVRVMTEVSVAITVGYLILRWGNKGMHEIMNETLVRMVEWGDWRVNPNRDWRGESVTVIRLQWNVCIHNCQTLPWVNNSYRK